MSDLIKKPIWLVIAVWLHSVCGLEAESAEKPNIVLILADDLGWSDLGCYGGEIPTPNLDSLAQGGLRFTQIYNNSVCGPSRASLLTGLYAQRVGHSGKHWNEPTDYQRSITIGEGLQLAGYHTMMVGKWQDPDLPTDRGFDRYYGPLTAGKISYFDEVQLNPFYLDDERVALPDDFYLTDALTDYAIEFVEESVGDAKVKDRPFFLYFAHIAPHWPLHALEEEVAPHRTRYQQHGWDHWREVRTQRQREMGLVPEDWPLSPMPAGVHHWEVEQHKEWQAELMAVYAAQVASIDKSAGRLIEVLKRKGAFENTLFLFVSDNGAAHDGSLQPVDRMLGFAPDAKMNTAWRVDGGEVAPGTGPDHMPGPRDTFAAYGLAWALTSNAPLRDTKLTGYEGGVRTPMIAHWPRGIEAKGEIIDVVGHLFDLMPTFLDLAEGDYPSRLNGRRPLPLDGRSLAPAFRGESVDDHEYLAWRVYKHRALRMGDWKIVSEEEDARWELYNIIEDGTETRNLAAERPDIVTRLAAKWRDWLEECEKTQRKL